MAKIFLVIMPIFMLVDNFYFKKKMNCGNMKTPSVIKVENSNVTVTTLVTFACANYRFMLEEKN